MRSTGTPFQRERTETWEIATGSVEGATTYGQTPPTSLGLRVWLLPGAGEFGWELRLRASVGREATTRTDTTLALTFAPGSPLALSKRTN